VSNVTDAAFTVNADAVSVANAIDTAEYFVRQQCLDFLGHEPDQEGFEFWTAQLNPRDPNNSSAIELQRSPLSDLRQPVA
jgi:hypothetical protein